MTDVRALQERLERTFRGAFFVRDVTETLVSFDFSLPAASALERARRRGFALNGLAHSQDIVTGDWEMILRLAGRLEDIVLLGSTFARPRRTRRRTSTPGP